jgi:hypothetical protein
MKASTASLLMAVMAAGAYLDGPPAFIDPEPIKPIKPVKRGGRWVAVYFIGGVRSRETTRGARFHRRSEAVGFARMMGGYVRRFRVKEWRVVRHDWQQVGSPFIRSWATSARIFGGTL